MRESMTALINKRSLTTWLKTETGRGFATAVMEILERRGKAEHLGGVSNIEHVDRVVAVTEEAVSSYTETGEPRYLELGAKAHRELGTRRQVADNVSLFANRWVDKLEFGNAYWTSPDIVSMIDQAARDLPDDFQLLNDDLIEPAGLAYLAKPINIADVPIQAISWHATGGKVELIAYAPRHGGGDAIGHQVATTSKDHLPLLVPCGFEIQPFGAPVRDQALHKFMTAWWKLIEQPVFTREVSKPRNSEVRKDRRLRTGDLVTEVRLRSTQARHYQPDHEPSWSYSHRFMVRGHWRNQPYGDGHTERIYIHPYVKGPADKPIIIREHVYRWDR